MTGSFQRLLGWLYGRFPFVAALITAVFALA